MHPGPAPDRPAFGGRESDGNDVSCVGYSTTP
jgi:hypothetical protein